MSSIDDYEIENKLIGKGAFGFVKKAKIKKNGKEVAIKYLKYETEEELNSFLKEVIFLKIFKPKIKILYKLSHKNIVETYDSFLFQDQVSCIKYFCIVMEYCDSNLSKMNIETEKVNKKLIKRI
jgi:serine/threonine protein kinase